MGWGWDGLGWDGEVRWVEVEYAKCWVVTLGGACMVADDACIEVI